MGFFVYILWNGAIEAIFVLFEVFLLRFKAIYDRSREF
jgi:hypothetical protein